MSFDLYLQAFDHGQPAGLSLHLLRESFGSELVELEEDFWQLQFEAGRSSDLFLQPWPGEPELIHNISIHRPCTDMRLFVAIWKLLGNPGTILYFPGCAAPLARDSLAGTSMPPEMIEALGEPVLIRNAAEISQAIELS
jgi:hypothetical protein